MFFIFVSLPETALYGVPAVTATTGGCAVESATIAGIPHASAF